MACIYIGMFISLTLCLIGVVLSIIDVNKYNFGLYLALLSIVTFTVSLACMVVKPSVCRGPRCLTKLLRRSFRRPTPRRPLPNCDPRPPPPVVREVLYCHKENPDGVVENVNVITRPPSVIIQPPPEPKSSPPPEPKYFRPRLHSQSAKSDVVKNLRFVDEVETIGDVKAARRRRAWTVPSSFWRRNNNNAANTSSRNAEEDNNELKDWQRLIITRDPNLLLHTAFPLCERTPLKTNLDLIASHKSHSNEEVVNLRDYFHRGSSSARQSRKKSSVSYPYPNVLNYHHENRNSISATVSRKNSTTSCSRKNSTTSSRRNSRTTFNPAVNPWRRSHTIIVKYVPVRTEWIPRPVSPSTSSELDRERSHSSAGLPCEQQTFTMVSHSRNNTFRRKFFPNFLPTNRQSSSRIESLL